MSIELLAQLCVEFRRTRTAKRETTNEWSERKKTCESNFVKRKTDTEEDEAHTWHSLVLERKINRMVDWNQVCCVCVCVCMVWCASACSKWADVQIGSSVAAINKCGHTHTSGHSKLKVNGSPETSVATIGSDRMAGHEGNWEENEGANMKKKNQGQKNEYPKEEKEMMMMKTKTTLRYLLRKSPDRQRATQSKN